MSSEVSGSAEAVKTTVRDFILDEFLPGVPAAELSDTTPLVSGGILDSLATVRLVAMLEERYGIEIQAHEASADHLNTLSGIARLVVSKLPNTV